MLARVLSAMTGLSGLVNLMVVLPLFTGLLAIVLPRLRARLPVLAVLISAVQVFLAVSLWGAAWESVIPVRSAVEGVLSYGMSVHIDALSRLFVLVAAVLWLLASVFAFSYMAPDRSKYRFYSFLLITLGGCQGVFLAGDLFTLFVFFELMSFSSYALVVHTQKPQAMSAGALYIFMGMAGGLMLLSAVSILNFAVGTTAFLPSMDALSAKFNPYLVGVLFLLGFGIKAGMVPVHFWLPRTYPVAPAAASALLSGVLSKTGLYGLIRTFGSVMVPESAASELWGVWHGIGALILVLAVLTTFTGGLSALLERDSRRLIAYSSVSQMGYLLLGLGVAMRYPKVGALAFGGVLLHVMSHAVFKSGLFMMAGARLAGFSWGSNRWTRALGYIPLAVFAMGIAAVPGMNGFASKTLLHHAVEKAHHYYPGAASWLVAFLFSVAGALTGCYAIRLVLGLMCPQDTEHRTHITWTAGRAALYAAAALVLLAGRFPEHLVSRAIAPAVGSGPWATGLSALEHEVFYTLPNVSAMVPVLLTSLLLFIIGTRLGLFGLCMPTFMNAELVFIRPLLRVLLRIIQAIYYFFDRRLDEGYEKLPQGLGSLARRLSDLDQAVSAGYDEAGRLAHDATRGVLKVDVAISKKYEDAEQSAKSALNGLADAESSLERAYERLENASSDASSLMRAANSGPRSFRWNSINLNTGALLLTLVLMLFLMGLMASGYWMWNSF